MPRARRCGGEGGGARAEPSARAGGGGGTNQRISPGTGAGGTNGGVGRGGRTLPQLERGGGRKARLASGACGPVVAGTGGQARLYPREQRGSQGSGPRQSLSLAGEQPGSAGWVPFLPSGCPEQAENRGAVCVWHTVRPAVPGPFAGWPWGSVARLVIAGAGVVRFLLSRPCCFFFFFLGLEVGNGKSPL